MAATRTQVYLTADQRKRLDERSRRDGRPMAELVREALDAYLVEGVVNEEEALRSTFGVIPNLIIPTRDEWDRG